MSDAQFYGIYCDDVRHEHNGKITLVGCYGPHMLVPQLPFIVRNLCLSFTYKCPADNVPDSVTIVVEQDDKPLFNISMTVDAATESRSKDTSFTLNGGFEMVDIDLQESSNLRSYIEANGERLVGPGLNIERATASAGPNAH